MNKEERIKYLKHRIEKLKSALPKKIDHARRSEYLFGPVDPYGNSWEDGLVIDVQGTLNDIKKMEEELAKLEEKQKE